MESYERDFPALHPGFSQNKPSPPKDRSPQKPRQKVFKRQHQTAASKDTKTPVARPKTNAQRRNVPGPNQEGFSRAVASPKTSAQERNVPAPNQGYSRTVVRPKTSAQQRPTQVFYEAVARRNGSPQQKFSAAPGARPMPYSQQRLAFASNRNNLDTKPSSHLDPIQNPSTYYDNGALPFESENPTELYTNGTHPLVYEAYSNTKTVSAFSGASICALGFPSHTDYGGAPLGNLPERSVPTSSPFYSYLQTLAPDQPQVHFEHPTQQFDAPQWQQQMAVNSMSLQQVAQSTRPYSAITSLHMPMQPMAQTLPRSSMVAQYHPTVQTMYQTEMSQPPVFSFANKNFQTHSTTALHQLQSAFHNNTKNDEDDNSTLTELYRYLPALAAALISPPLPSSEDNVPSGARPPAETVTEETTVQSSDTPASQAEHGGMLQSMNDTLETRASGHRIEQVINHIDFENELLEEMYGEHTHYEFDSDVELDESSEDSQVGNESSDDIGCQKLDRNISENDECQPQENECSEKIKRGTMNENERSERNPDKPCQDESPTDEQSQKNELVKSSSKDKVTPNIDENGCLEDVEGLKKSKGASEQEENSSPRGKEASEETEPSQTGSNAMSTSLPVNCKEDESDCSPEDIGGFAASLRLRANSLTADQIEFDWSDVTAPPTLDGTRFPEEAEPFEIWVKMERDCQAYIQSLGQNYAESPYYDCLVREE